MVHVPESGVTTSSHVPVSAEETAPQAFPPFAAMGSQTNGAPAVTVEVPTANPIALAVEVPTAIVTDTPEAEPVVAKIDWLTAAPDDVPALDPVKARTVALGALAVLVPSDAPTDA